MTGRDDRAETSVDDLARRAADGDREALSALVREIQQPMYRLTLRFLGNPDDAQDATQEILIRIVTRLGTFEGRSKFTTWAYIVAVRSLLRTRKRFAETAVQGPEEFAAALDAGMGDIDPTIDEVEYRLLCEEVRISCTYGMLLCLARHSRAAYLLADVLGLTDADGAEILDCTARDVPPAGVAGAAHAAPGDRQPVRLVDPANPCRCGRQIASSEDAGILDRSHLSLASWSRGDALWIEPIARQLDTVAAIGDLYRFDRFAAPSELWGDFRSRFPELLDTD